MQASVHCASVILPPAFAIMPACERPQALSLMVPVQVPLAAKAGAVNSVIVAAIRIRFICYLILLTRVTGSLHVMWALGASGYGFARRTEKVTRAKNARMVRSEHDGSARGQRALRGAHAGGSGGRRRRLCGAAGGPRPARPAHRASSAAVPHDRGCRGSCAG